MAPCYLPHKIPKPVPTFLHCKTTKTIIHPPSTITWMFIMAFVFLSTYFEGKLPNTQPFWILFVERNSTPKSKRKNVHIRTIDGRNPKQAPGMVLEPCLSMVDFNYLSLNWFSPGTFTPLSASLAVSPRSKPKRKRSIPNLRKRWSWCTRAPNFEASNPFFISIFVEQGIEGWWYVKQKHMPLNGSNIYVSWPNGMIFHQPRFFSMK